MTNNALPWRRRALPLALWVLLLVLAVARSCAPPSLPT
jgi:hypothetical protein